MKIYLKSLYFICTLVFFTSCSSDKKQVYEKSPVDQLIVDYNAYPDYTIILSDMDQSGNEIYKHRYTIITEELSKKHKDSTIFNTKQTDWKPVSVDFFNRHLDDLGMAIVTRTNGTLSKVPAPAGYTNYVGNSKYGEWKTNNSGDSFWSFYGKYAMLSAVFRTFNGGYGYGGYHRSSWNSYDRNYRGRQPYYGTTSSGGTQFGSRSTTNNTQSTWAQKPKSFKDKVRSQVKQSSRNSSSRSYKSNSSYSGSSSNKKSSSSSRYSGSSSTRSRGGGFGK